ncbi:MAG TPA: glycine cleavage T C-terminal barrel domain-containing protein, partial [Candidatus Methanomethylicus sp.]|nr:glycine cleavage T C-terminal barrel domain-containing protein [Candidatus Methanomethylicus sp.]
MDGRIIPREGQRIIHKGNDIGRVTSGTFSPTVGSSVAMGYASPPPGAGERVQVEIRGRMVGGTVVAMPFYDPSVYGWKRIRR